MNRVFLPIAAVVIGVSSLPASAAPESYTLDPFHTYVHFEVDHLGGFSRMRGRFDKVAGKFTLDTAAKTGSIDVTVQTASISTGDNDKGNRPRARDEHLRSPDFFNVAEFPTMTLKSTRVVFTGDNPSSIEAVVTLLGVSKPVTLAIESWRCGPHPGNKRILCGANASGTIKRSDFGMKFGIPGVGDEQKLWIEMEGYKD
jgi:polyisoprenoid-binding protein YceI